MASIIKPRGLALTFLTLVVTALPTWAAAQDTDEERPERRRRNRDRDRQAEQATDDGYSVTIAGDVDAEMAAVAAEMTKCFYDCYPKLIERFDNPDKPASKHIRILFRKGIRVPAFCSGAQVTVSVDWLKQHPEDIGMLTHELTHAVQQYPQPNPGWLTEGIADYTRKVFGPEEQPNWALPSKLTSRNSWTDSYRVTGRFLEWLEEKHPGTVDKIHVQLQKGQYNDAQFEEYTGSPLEKLRTDCVRELSGEAAERAVEAEDAKEGTEEKAEDA